MGVIDVDTSERHLDVPPRPDGLISIMYLTDFVIILLCILDVSIVLCSGYFPLQGG